MRRFLRHHGLSLTMLVLFFGAFLIGAGSRGDFREEDQLCCAWIADELVGAGYVPTDDATVATIERWRGASVDVIGAGASAAYLRRSNQLHDLEFITSHVNDLYTIYRSVEGRIEPVSIEAQNRA